MKTYFLVLALIFCCIYPSTQAVAKIPCETCYKQAGVQYDYSLSRYVAAAQMAVTQTATNLGGMWASFFSSGLTTWSWGNFWGLFFSYGYFGPYNDILAAEAQWARDLDAMLIMLNYCIAQCGVSG